MLPRLDAIDADAPLELDCERGLEYLQHAGRAGLLALLDVADEVLVDRAHVVDRTAAADAGRQVALVHALVEHQHAARARTAEELVRREKHGVDRRVAVRRVALRIHVDPDVGRARREVEAGVGVIRVQQPRDLVHRRAHAGHVRGGGERADPEASPVLGRAQQLLQVREVHAAVGGEVHLDDGRESLPPGDLVRVVLVGADENDRLPRLLVAAEVFEALVPEELAQPLADRLAGRGRQEHAEDLLQLVDRARGTRAAGDDAAVRARVHRALDRALRLVQQPAHAAAGEVVLGVRVRVDTLQRLQVALDEHQATT